jgi:methylisocitrate lyase
MSKAGERRIALKTMIAAGKTLALPGVHDCISAKLAEQAGFPAIYVGSYATCASGFGLADVGAVTMDEMAAYAKRIVDAVDVPVLADGENGWNNPANIWRTVQTFEQAGVCGIHIEDHEFGKHAPVTQVLATPEQMVQKVRAALDAREDENFLIIARTDAAWVSDDIEDAIRRMNLFTEAGADLVMAPGLEPQKLATIRSRIKGRIVLVDTPGCSVTDEKRAGADVVLYYGFTLYAAYDSVKRALAAFATTRNADAVPGVRDQITAFEDFIGYPEFAERARRYKIG